MQGCVDSSYMNGETSVPREKVSVTFSFSALLFLRKRRRTNFTYYEHTTELGCLLHLSPSNGHGLCREWRWGRGSPTDRDVTS